MELYCDGGVYKLYHGDMLDMLSIIEPNSIDSIVTDPPYELNFMAKRWDHSGVSFQMETWEKCLNVLKPGGHLLCFGGSRTFHRIACAIEDAGFEIRDTICWLYGTGFPKSMNIGLAIDKKNGLESKVVGINGNMPDLRDVGKKSKESIGIDKLSFGQVRNADRKDCLIYEAQNEFNGWGTQLKPSYEPIIVARKPCKGSIVNNVLKYGVGGINIDECRVQHDEELKTTNRQPKSGEVFNTETSGYDNTQNHIASADPKGRFPANTILTYDDSDYDEVCGGFPQTVSSGGSGEKSKINTFANTYNGGWGHDKNCSHLGGLGDSGSAARYFYCAKASRRDRDEGLDAFEAKQKYYCDGRGSSLEIFGSTDGGRSPLKNIHPTVKPTMLMQYLVRLVTPKGGTVLDPFNGSGSTGKAVMWENRDNNKGYKYIGIELSEDYLTISKARIDYANDSEYVVAVEEEKAPPKKTESPGQVLNLFDDI